MSIFQDNRELLDAFRKGERQALAKVYEHYVDQVATLARRGFTMDSQGHVYVRGRDPEVERELVQETFSRAFSEKARNSFDGLRPYRPFLLRITKNLMIDRYRSEKRSKETSEARGAGDIDEILERNADLAPEVDVEGDLHWKALREATTRFVSGESTETQELVRLRFEEECSQEEAAKRMGISRRRVRTLEARVQKSLRKHLRSQGLWDPSEKSTEDMPPS
jgi:RNA polymerase sigma-70 factor (ECF subfamily)